MDSDRHKIHEPKLELLMSAWHELSSSDIANDHKFSCQNLITPFHFLKTNPFGIVEGESIRNTLWSTVFTNEEKPNVDEQHNFFESWHKVFGIVYFMTNLMPKD